MLKQRLSRIVVLAVLCTGLSALVSETASADDTEPDPGVTAKPDGDADAADEEATDDSAAGEGNLQLRGKIVVIRPDGHRREFEMHRSFRAPFLGGPGRVARIPRGNLLPFGLGETLKGLDPDAAPDAEESAGEEGVRYFIGLHCTPADETLKQQLGLERQGLVVRRVVPDMPAAEAALQEHDILLSIGEEPLNTIDQLMDAVQAAGDAPIEVTFLRNGERQTVEITPVIRESLFASEGPGIRGEIGQWLRSQLGEDVIIPSAPYRLDAVGPGILLRESAVGVEEADRIEALEERVEELAEQVAELREILEERR